MDIGFVANDVSWWQVLVLAVVQGLTEFLPVSSTAHLILLSWVTHWPDQGVVFDIAAHLGTLLAVVGYFRRDLWRILIEKHHRELLALLLASVPLMIFGLLLHKSIETHLRSVWVIAVSSVIFGALLWLADKWHRVREGRLRPVHLLKMGLWQVLALIPGASRSGVTLTGGLFMGLDKTAAARGTFLLSIPALIMVTAYGGLKIMRQPATFPLLELSMVVLVSFAVAWLSIGWFMRFIQKTPLSWFGVYRIVLGMILMVWLLAG